MVKIFRLNLKTLLLETPDWQLSDNLRISAHQSIQTHRCHLDAPPYDLNLLKYLAWHPPELLSVIIYELSGEPLRRQNNAIYQCV